MSDPIQGGDFNTYCTIDDIRNITNLNTNDLTDSNLFSIIEYAMSQINYEIMVYTEEEEIDYISNEKKNTQDGVNTVFYTKHWPLGDLLTNDGEISITDINVYSFDSSGVRTQLTVSSIDSINIGKFTLSAAPNSNVVLKVTYSWSPIGINLGTPNALLRKACMELSAAYAYAKVEPLLLKQLETITMVKMPSAYDMYMKQYRQTLRLLMTSMQMRDQHSSIPDLSGVFGN